MQPHARHALTPRNIEIRDNFDAIARRYDLTNRVISCGVDLHWRRVAVGSLTDLPAGSLVLDLACGTCDMARELLRQNPTVRIVGVDLSRSMLDLAARKFGGSAGAGHPVVLVNAPAEALPFPDAAFDAAMIAFGIRNVPDVSAGLAQLHRVLRPGGRAVILEFSTPPSRLLWHAYTYYFFHILPRIGGFLTGQERAYRYLTRSVSEFPPPAGFAAAMQETGFRSVAWRALTGGIVCIHTGVRG